ncbi:MAG TPA: regulatory protein RecX [Pseudomonadales bacterium]|jgi:regulatory protein
MLTTRRLKNKTVSLQARLSSLDDDAAEQLPTVDERQKAFRRAAMNSLARREHSRYELMQKLQQQGAEPAEAQAVVARLMAENLQSDLRFAEAMVRYQRNRSKGPLWIRQWLQEKGIDAGLIAEQLSGSDWLAEAQAVRERRFGPELPRTAQERAKQMRFLAQRGFSADQMRALFRD